MAVQLLKTSIDRLSDDSEEHRKISFIIEQLKLLSLSKFSRIYSPVLVIMSYMIYAASPAAYAALQEQNVVCLPSTTTLKKVTRRLNCGTGLDNSSYLKMRISKLNKYERTVLLIIDEIYIAKRVEYTSGEMQGLTPDGISSFNATLFYDQITSWEIQGSSSHVSNGKTNCGKTVRMLLESGSITKKHFI